MRARPQIERRLHERAADAAAAVRAPPLQLDHLDAVAAVRPRIQVELARPRGRGAVSDRIIDQQSELVRQPLGRCRIEGADDGQSGAAVQVGRPSIG